MPEGAKRAREPRHAVGNGVATVVVSKWDNALAEERLHRHLNRETEAAADDPEAVLVADELDQEPLLPGPKPLGA